jgi:ABC-type branched-subunit amino acid transport system ATPase component
MNPPWDFSPTYRRGDLRPVNSDLPGKGTTILIVDQNIIKALEVSEYMYMLDMGQVKKGGTKADFEDDIREMIRTSLMANQE